MAAKDFRRPTPAPIPSNIISPTRDMKRDQRQLITSGSQVASNSKVPPQKRARRGERGEGLLPHYPHQLVVSDHSKEWQIVL